MEAPKRNRRRETTRNEQKHWTMRMNQDDGEDDEDDEDDDGNDEEAQEG